MGTGANETARRGVIGLGSNLGDRLAYLRGAVSRLQAEPGLRLVATSGVYESPPMGPIAQADFLNAAVLIETTIAPRELLARCLAIEAEHGRVREVRWGPRTLDLDLLWVEGVTVEEPGLTLPHPGLAERAFVLRPLAELLPDLVLGDGRNARQAAEELHDDACVRLSGAHLGG
ncbi:MAG: 2-amino-4-hydroxy-6-hydroxymethyldihydropteridine diphosphokinase [Armatimonadetes bacterium]|nr:2-amino-4-hydroxy-6-hydroxymethyldihydropteridine diphosphokinase [Armatimonadota bacterium]